MPPKRKSLLPPPNEPSPKRVTRSDSKSSVTLLDRDDLPSPAAKRGRRSLGKTEVVPDSEEDEREEEQPTDEEDVRMKGGLVVKLDLRRSASRNQLPPPPSEPPTTGSGKRRGRPPKPNPTPIPDAQVPGGEMSSPMVDPFTPTKSRQVRVQYGRKSSSAGKRKVAALDSESEEGGRGRAEKTEGRETEEEEEGEELPESPTKGRSSSARKLRALDDGATPTRTPSKILLPSSPTRRAAQRAEAAAPVVAASPTDSSAQTTPSKTRGRKRMEVEVVIPLRNPSRRVSQAGQPQDTSPAKASPLRQEMGRAAGGEQKEAVTPLKRGPGRPRKVVQPELERAVGVEAEKKEGAASTPQKRGPGRPRKVVQPPPEECREAEVGKGNEVLERVVTPQKRGRGRPRKVVEPAVEEEVSVEQEEGLGNVLSPETGVAMEEDELEVDPPISADPDLPSSPSKPPAGPSLPTPLPMHLHPHLRAQQHQILSHLHRPPIPAQTPSPGEEGKAEAEDPVRSLESLLRGTVERGEGNSCLLLGPRGSGKTRAVDLALSQLGAKPIIVRLSGLTHPDDRSALRELQRQVLTALGQHSPAASPGPALQPTHEEEGDDSDPAPFAQLPALTRPLVVLLSEFDAFCLRPRQALLYVLLDAVQSLRGGSMGVAVVGMTARIDCVNLLEKRVKSRFSHRIIRVGGAQSVDDYLRLVRGFLLPPIGLSEEADEESVEWQDLWRKNVDTLLGDREVRTMLRQTWEVVHDVRVLQRVLTDLVARLNSTSPWLTPALLAQSLSIQRAPPSYPHLSNLSTPALGLLIAVHQAGTAGHDVFTFQMLESGYRAFARDHGTMGQAAQEGAVPRESLLAAYDTLIRQKVFFPAALPFAPGMREFGKYSCAVERREIEDAVRRGGSTGVKKWLKVWAGR